MAATIISTAPSKRWRITGSISYAWTIPSANRTAYCLERRGVQREPRQPYVAAACAVHARIVALVIRAVDVRNQILLRIADNRMLQLGRRDPRHQLCQRRVIALS